MEIIDIGSQRKAVPHGIRLLVSFLKLDMFIMSEN
jgi:hypothetical protein